MTYFRQDHEFFNPSKVRRYGFAQKQIPVSHTFFESAILIHKMVNDYFSIPDFSLGITGKFPVGEKSLLWYPINEASGTTNMTQV